MTSSSPDSGSGDTGQTPTAAEPTVPPPVAGIGGGVRPAGVMGSEHRPQPQPAPAKSRRVLGYRRQRFEARKVRRLVRHLDPWSVLKLSLLLALCLWLVGMIASVIIWSVANNTGALSSLERFANENLQLEDFRLVGSTLFRQFGLISLLAALGFVAAAVVFSLVFNLISDIIGGVWVTVIEEETARPVGAPAAPEQRSQPD